MWMGEVLLGNLGDTEVFGNLRTLHMDLYHLSVELFVLGALLLTLFGGFYGSYRTGRLIPSLRIGVWSGLISGAISLLTLLVMDAVFLDSFRRSPTVLAEFARSRDLDFTHFVYLDSLAGGASHLALGPSLGMTLGGIGGMLGTVARRVLDAVSRAGPQSARWTLSGR